MFSFGEDAILANERTGKTRIVAEVGVHVQARWRITVAERVVFGSGDIRRELIGDEDAVPPNDLLQRRFEAWLAVAPVCRISDVRATSTGDLTIVMGSDARIDVFVDSAEDEYWRILDVPRSEHIICTGNGIERRSK
jgi:hypothetical protein